MGRQWVDGSPVVRVSGSGKKPQTAGTDADLEDSIDLCPLRFQPSAYWDNYIEIWYRLGYDFVRLETCLNFPHPSREGGDAGRTYAETARGAIATWEDFEKYPWPSAKDEDFLPYEYIAANMPDGMGLIVCHAAGPLEHLTGLIGYEPLCVMLYDQPDLVQAVMDKIEQCVTPYIGRLLQVPRVIAHFQGDDMGFRTQTLISPDHLRQYILPVHKRYAALTHEAKLPYFLHSCGNTLAVMPDLIDEVKIDGKHSVEDAILPAREWKRLYGDRVGILGGVDVDWLCRLSPPELRKYVRKIIEDCQPGGRFVIGSGSSIADYVPVENLLTMLDEALK